MLPVAFQDGGPGQMRTEEDIPEMKVSDLGTAADLEAVRPVVFRELQERFIAEGRRQGISEERQRIEALVKGCHGNGGRLLEALTNEQAAAELLKSSSDELAENVDRLRRENAELRADIENRRAATMTDEELREKFAASPELQDQFSCAGAYIAGVRHTAKR